MNNTVTAHTDGSCLGNPGPGGWGVVLSHGQTRKELSQGYKLTTNNRMELLAAINALESLTRTCTVELYTDSKYVRDGIEKGWLANWKRNGWKTAAKKPVKNKDLWQRFDTALSKHNVTLHWVKGHAGNPDNERCDDLARQAASQAPTQDDPGFP